MLALRDGVGRDEGDFDRCAVDVPRSFDVPGGDIVENASASDAASLADDAKHIIFLFAAHQTLTDKWRIAEDIGAFCGRE